MAEIETKEKKKPARKPRHGIVCTRDITENVKTSRDKESRHGE